jgi:hypothetical protein
MKDKLIEHLSSEIQQTTETTMNFRTRIVLIAWAGPFILLSSVVVSTKGFFHIPERDPVLLGSLIVVCACYLALGVIAGYMERLSWRRCDYLRGKIIEYTKLVSFDDVKDSDFAHPRMASGAMPCYLWAFSVILVSFISASIAISRMAKEPPDQGEQRSSPSSVESSTILANPIE